MGPTGPARGRTRTGWAMWVILAVLVICGGGLVWTMRTRGPLRAPPYPPPQAENTLYSNRIYSLDTITTAREPQKLAGYRAELMNVRVAAVGPGRVFWIADPGGRRIAVIPTNPNVPIDAAKAGGTVSLVATVEKPGSEPQVAERWNLDPATAAKIAADAVFLRAGSIRPGGVPSRNEGQGL